VALSLIAELDGVLAAFDTAGIEYALCGGLAMAVHGFPRFTKDIDLLVLAEQLDAALQVVRSQGFDIPARKMTFGLRTGTPRIMQRASKLEDSTGRLTSVDLLVVAYEYEAVWDARVRLPWRGREISVVSRDGLATMKKLSGRPLDLRDVDILEGRAQSPDEHSDE
jgi:Nucleotidyl transferase AbiEii toxin, Type IV TA system